MGRPSLRAVAAIVTMGGGAVAFILSTAAASTPPLQAPQRLPDLGLDTQLWDVPNLGKGDKPRLLRAIDYSLRYLNTDAADAAYRTYPMAGITRSRVRQSLLRFRTLVKSASSAEALKTAVQREFVAYPSAGKDDQGTVEFTGYYEATYRASRVPTAEYRYPLYRLPSGFSQWAQPHPTRLQLEGADGLQGGRGKLRGAELVWLRDRLEAFLVQVQGSARLTLPDGKVLTIGVAGKTNYPYTSLGKELVKAGKVKLEDLSLPFVTKYFQTHPTELNDYIPRNQRFVFFNETYGAPATGSLGVPVTAERSIATDKTLMPPGALAVIQTRLPHEAQNSKQSTVTQEAVTRFVLDQDTGGAIKGPGRVDIFMGTGARAKAKAGLVNSPGQLYYLLLKPGN
jgi:membrane-bound lytic murein transglycosylase A